MAGVGGTEGLADEGVSSGVGGIDVGIGVSIIDVGENIGVDGVDSGFGVIVGGNIGVEGVGKGIGVVVGVDSKGVESVGKRVNVVGVTADVETDIDVRNSEDDEGKLYKGGDGDKVKDEVLADGSGDEVDGELTVTFEGSVLGSVGVGLELELETIFVVALSWADD